MHRVNMFVEPTRANYHAAAQKHKTHLQAAYSETAEFHRKAAAGDTIYIFFSVCQRLFI